MPKQDTQAIEKLNARIMESCKTMKIDSQGKRLAQEHIASSRLTNSGAISVTLSPNIPNTRAERFYRAMATEEYAALLRNDYLIFKKGGYGGITTTRSYCESTKYMSTGPMDREPERGTHMVEFMVPPTLKDALVREGLTEKGENGATSFGLGPGQKNGVGGQEFRNKSHMISWKLVGLTVRSEDQKKAFEKADALALHDVTTDKGYNDE